MIPGWVAMTSLSERVVPPGSAWISFAVSVLVLVPSAPGSAVGA